MIASLEPTPAVAQRAAPSAASARADWRYPARPTPRWGFVFAILCSVCLHGMMVLGVNPRPPRAVVAAAPQAELVQMEMPPIPPEEPEEVVQELTEEQAAPAIAVPQLADVPSLVELSDFQQTIDLRPATGIDLAALKQMTIPVNIARGGAGGAGAGSIFNLADLDRRPEPIAQPAPVFPYEPKRDGVTDARVVVQFVVDADGRVLSPTVTESSDDRFNQAALIGVSRWKFRAGMKGGRRVATRMEVPLLFSTQED